MQLTPGTQLAEYEILASIGAGRMGEVYKAKDTRLDRIVEVPWRHTPEKRVPGDVRRCDVRIDLRGKSVKLPIKEVVDAFWFSQGPGTILDKGKVVHDYLA